MPIEFTHFAEPRLLVTRFFGPVDDAELARAYAQVFSDSPLRPGDAELVLHERDLHLDVTQDGMLQQILRTNRFHGERSFRSANVVGSLNHEAVLGVFKSMTAAIPDAAEQVEIFSGVSEALAALGIDAAQVPLDLERFDFDHQLVADDSHLRAMQAVLEAEFVSVHEKNRRLLELATTDALTGLPNRARFDEEVRSEIRRFQRHRRPVCLALMDLDHFKDVNDRLGHLAGDEMLRELATLLRRSVRAIDLVSRWGGDEFALLIPEATTEEAHAALERIRAAVEVRYASTEAPVTISAGAVMLEENLDPEAWFSRADANLYRAKETGRNCIVWEAAPD